MENRHETVLLEEAVSGLCVVPGDIVVDGTVGGAGHFTKLLEKLEGTGTLIGIDADSDALERARAHESEFGGTRVHLVEDNFRNLDRILADAGVPTISKALFDLGWSSFHLSSGRGFSFRADEPLHMTYGTPRAGKTAADMVNDASEEALADLFFSLGEERFARQIARGIAEARVHAPVETTGQLVEIILAVTPKWYQNRRIHPATKTFQALRIAVNDELGALREGLGAALAHLSVGGRIAVISFHSIEDRIVKSMFRDAAYAGEGTVITKKPVTPSLFESTKNPRARSAKLRIFERTASSTLQAPTNLSPYMYA